MKQDKLRELPVIKRAREYYLYDNSGRRYLDLYLNGGRAFLGHRPKGLSLEIKNIISRGLYSEYPGVEESKMYKIIEKLWGDRFPYRTYYSNRERAFLLNELSMADLKDPALGEQGDLMVCRPLLETPSAQTLIPIIPLPGGDQSCIVLSTKKLAPSDIPSPISAGALSRSLWNLFHLDKPVETPKSHKKNSPEKIEFDISLGALWERFGPYCHYLGSKESYNQLFDRALKLRVLLPPSMEEPVIIPLDLTHSDVKLLKKVFGA